MVTERFTTTSSDGKTTLAAYKLVPEHPRAMVQISHGMCEYFLRYEEFARYLTESGFLVFGHDHLGHGYSVSDPADLGYTVKGGGTNALVEDVHNLTLRMKQEYPGPPVILFGHSMGSFIARNVAAAHGSTYHGFIFCGTCGSEQPTGFGMAFVSLLMRLYGEHHRSALVTKIAFGGYNKKFGKNSDKNAWLTADAKIQENYGQDPFCGFCFTLRGYHDLFSLIHTISRRDWAGKLPKEKPVLVISGEMDPVGNYGKGVREVADRLTDAGVRDVTLKLYPEMRHEIINDVNRDISRKDLLEWMKEKCN